MELIKCVSFTRWAYGKAFLLARTEVIINVIDKNLIQTHSKSARIYLVFMEGMP
jgi:hypothetical protein